MAENNTIPESSKFDAKVKVRIPYTKWDKIRLIGATIGFFICIGLLIYIEKDSAKSYETSLKTLNYFLRMTKEQGYAEGQADAMKGLIRIEKLNDTTYVWTSTPFGNKYPINDTIYTKR